MTHSEVRNFAYEAHSESIGLCMKSKQVPLIEKCICLTILYVNLVHKFSERYLSCSLNFTTNK